MERKIAKGEPSIELHLIRGIDKSHPSWYRACVTPEIPFDKITVGRYVAVMCRKHTMTPKDTSNLDNFERVYSQLNKCQLVAVEIDDQMHVNMKIDFSEAIELKGSSLLMHGKYRHTNLREMHWSGTMTLSFLSQRRPLPPSLN